LGFGDPIPQFEVFSYFATFVAVLFRLIGTVIDLAEWVLGVANYVGDDLDGFRHGLVPLLIILRTASSENSASVLGFVRVVCVNAAVTVIEAGPK
jgi:hypothetical protein